VLAGVRSNQKDEARKLHIDMVALDDDTELARIGRLDSIADTVNGSTLQKLLDKVKHGGGLIPRAEWSHPDPKRLAALAQAAARGDLVIPIVARLPLERVRDAQTMSERGLGGKSVLRLH